MEIRELKAKDVKAVAKMLGKLKPESVNGILGSIDKSDKLLTGLAIFRIVAADLTDDIYNWLADLIGETPAEMDEMPMSTPADIIRTLIKRGDFRDFLSSAAGLTVSISTTSSSPATAGETAKSIT